MLFLISLLIIVLTNLNMTRKYIPLKDNLLRLANLVAAGLLLFWGIRNGAFMSGGGMMA